MAGSSWKSPFSNQEMSETKTFTWRLRPHETHITGTGPGTGTTMVGRNETSSLNPARNSKSTNLSGITRGLAITPATTNASHSVSSSVLPTTASLLHLQQQQQQMEKFLRFQEFELEAGQSLGLHSMWSLFLISCGSSALANQKSNTNLSAGINNGSSSSSSSANSPSMNSDFIGLFLRKILKSSKSANSSYKTGDQVIGRYKIEIMDREGEILYTKEFETEARSKFEVGFWDWKKMVPLSTLQNGRNKLSGIPLESASNSIGGNAEESILLLRVSFTVVTRRKETGKGKTSHENDAHSLEETSTSEAANAFLSLVTTTTNTGSKSLQPDFVIEIPNRRKFSVHKKMLSDRSSFFHNLLDPESKQRFRGNVVKVDDLSANVMELILRHMYTGQLEEEWTTNPVTITELIYASEKYGLPALKDFCSKHLVKAATKNNCYKLMEVAQMHNLEQAAEDLMSYVSEGISSNTNSRKASEESVHYSSSDI